MNPFLTQLWTCSWQAAVAAMLVLLARFIFQKRLSPGWRCGLWAIVLLRLLIPTLPTSPLSLFGMTRWHASDTSRRPSVSSESQAHASLDDSMTTRTGFLPPDSGVMPFQRPIYRVSAEVSVNRPRPSVNVLAIAWLLGIIVLTLRFAWTNIRFTRRLSDVQAVTNGPIFELLEQCCNELAIQRAPTLLLTDTVNVPALTGVFRPRILIPSNLAVSLASNQLRLVFLHELCHLKRHDLTIDWICTAINLLHWFNPLLWIAARSYRADRELLRDTAVLHTAGPDSAESYGLTILTMAKRPTLPGYRPLVAAFIQGRGQIHERVQMIAAFNASRSRFSVLGLILVILVGCLTLTRPKSSDAMAQEKTGAVATTQSTSQPTLPMSLEDRRPNEPVANAKVQAALSQRVTEMNYDGMSIGDMFDQFRDQTGANLSVDWNAIMKIGVTHRTSIGLRLLKDGLRSGVTELTYDDTSTTPYSTVNIGWTYDNLGRLQTEARSGSTNSGDDYTANYCFDLAGNRTQYVRNNAATTTVVYAINARDEVTAESSTLLNNTTTSTSTYDDNGSLLTKNVNGTLTESYTWDLRNRMIQASISGTPTSYTYDTDGFRVGETTGTRVRVFLPDRMNPTGGVQAIEETLNGVQDRGYVLGLTVVAQTDAQGIAYLLRDGHGSTRLLGRSDGSIIPDAGGVHAQVYAYDAFGTAIGFNANTARTTQLFGGDGEYDVPTGLTYHNARFRQGYRFISMDDVRYGRRSDPISLHKYLYVDGNPISLFDPSGHFGYGELLITTTILGALVGGSIGGVVAHYAGYKATSWQF